MGKAMFYHLTRGRMEGTLAVLLRRALEQDWRVAVRGRDVGALEALDLALWTHDKASFLPHGIAGGPQDADQPVLLTLDRAAANDPACVVTIGAAEISAEEVAGLERLSILFDGNDEAELERARDQWRLLKAAGVMAEYWSESSGRWEKMAQT